MIVSYTFGTLKSELSSDCILIPAHSAPGRGFLFYLSVWSPRGIRRWREGLVEPAVAGSVSVGRGVAIAVSAAVAIGAAVGTGVRVSIASSVRGRAELDGQLPLLLVERLLLGLADLLHFLERRAVRAVAVAGVGAVAVASIGVAVAASVGNESHCVDRKIPM